MKIPVTRALAITVLAALLSGLGGCDRFRSPESHVKRAEAAMADGDKRRAVVELLNALKKDPNVAGARLMLADAALWLGDARGAERELKLVKPPVDEASLASLRVRVALALGNNDAALEVVANDTIAWQKGQREFLRGNTYLQLGRLADAANEYQAAFAADPALVTARAAELEVRAALGDRVGAIAALAQLTKEHPDSAAAWLTYGAQLASGGDTRNASVALQRAQAVAPKQLDVPRRVTLLAALVETQLLEGQIDAARASADELGRLAPDALATRYVRSRLAMASNDYVSAVAQLRNIVQGAPAFTQARLLLAMALVAQGNLEQGSLELNELVRLAPENAIARQLLAQVRMRLDDPDGALRMLVPALQSRDDNPQVNALVDAARSRLGATQSVSLLEQMLEKDPDNAGLQTQLASAYLQAGAPEKAAALLRKKNGPDARSAALLLQAITKSEGAQAARTQVDSLVAKNPGDATLVSLAAGFYLRANDAAAGRNAIDAALKRNADPRVLLLTLAQLEWSVGQRDAATAAVTRLLTLEPANAAANMAAGEMSLARRDYPNAREHFSEVLKARPESIEGRLRLAQVSLLQSQTKAADDLLAEAVKLAPKRADVRNAAGVLNLTSGRADQAMAQFRAAVEIDGADPVSWFNLASAQHALGQGPAARESLEKALAARPNWLPAAAALVGLDIETRKAEAAFARIEALKKADPRNSDVLELEADANAMLQRYRESAAAFEAAFTMRPSAAIAARDYRVRLAGNLPDGTRLLERWITGHPNDASSLGLLADAAIRGGDNARAAQHYRAILEHRPDDVVALNNLAWVYQQMDDPRAIDLARRAVAVAPQSSATNDTLGWLLVLAGKTGEALPYLSAAVKVAPADAEIGFHHAAALARAGQGGEARQRLDILLREHPKFVSRAKAEALLQQLSSGALGSP